MTAPNTTPHTVPKPPVKMAPPTTAVALQALSNFPWRHPQNSCQTPGSPQNGGGKGCEHKQADFYTVCWHPVRLCSVQITTGRINPVPCFGAATRTKRQWQSQSTSPRRRTSHTHWHPRSAHSNRCCSTNRTTTRGYRHQILGSAWEGFQKSASPRRNQDRRGFKLCLLLRPTVQQCLRFSVSNVARMLSIVRCGISPKIAIRSSLLSFSERRHVPSPS